MNLFSRIALIVGLTAHCAAEGMVECVNVLQPPLHSNSDLLRIQEISSQEISSNGIPYKELTLYHGTGVEHIQSVTNGPRDVGYRTNGGRGLYVSTSYGEAFKVADRAYLNVQVIRGLMNPQRDFSIAILVLHMDSETMIPAVRDGILHVGKNWVKKYPWIEKYLVSKFDVVDLRYEGTTVQYPIELIFHERAGSNAILWP